MNVASDSPQAYIPEDFDWPKIDSLVDIVKLGKDKIKRLQQHWSKRKQKVEAELENFCKDFHGSQYWEFWRGDARWYGGGSVKKTFKTNKNNRII